MRHRFKVSQMTTEQQIISTFGILLNMQDVARLLNRSPEGLRVTLTRDGELSQKLSSAKVKFGRRVMFKASAIAQIIDEA